MLSSKSSSPTNGLSSYTVKDLFAVPILNMLSQTALSLIFAHSHAPAATSSLLMEKDVYVKHLSLNAAANVVSSQEDALPPKHRNIRLDPQLSPQHVRCRLLARCPLAHCLLLARLHDPRPVSQLRHRLLEVLQTMREDFPVPQASNSAQHPAALIRRRSWSPAEDVLIRLRVCLAR